MRQDLPPRDGRWCWLPPRLAVTYRFRSREWPTLGDVPAGRGLRSCRRELSNWWPSRAIRPKASPGGGPTVPCTRKSRLGTWASRPSETRGCVSSSSICLKTLPRTRQCSARWSLDAQSPRVNTAADPHLWSSPSSCPPNACRTLPRHSAYHGMQGWRFVDAYEFGIGRAGRKGRVPPRRRPIRCVALQSELSNHAQVDRVEMYTGRRLAGMLIPSVGWCASGLRVRALAIVRPFPVLPLWTDRCRPIRMRKACQRVSRPSPNCLGKGAACSGVGGCLPF